MLFNWFNTKDVDEFASSMVAEMIKRIPPAKEMQEKKLREKIGKAHDVMLRQAENFLRTHKLNVYTKARLGNRFKWELAEAGYPPKFVDSWTYDLVTFVAAKSAAGREGTS